MILKSGTYFHSCRRFALQQVRRIRHPLSVAVLLVGASIAVALPTLATYRANSVEYSNSYIAHWAERIHTIGGASAYNEFICSIKESRDSVDAHFLGHEFGAALYIDKGIAGISGICDDRFRYACMHEVYGRAIAEYGLPVIPALSDSCINPNADARGLCVHGIGHGIVAYLGYNKSDRDAAIQSCRTISDSGMQNACTSGVFMEYFGRTLLGDSEHTVYPVEKDNLYEPCSGLSDADLEQCVVELPRVWVKSFFLAHATGTDTLRTLGEYCEAYVSNTRGACFRGLGNVIFYFQQGEPEAVYLSRCNAVAEGGDRRNCRTQVQWLFAMQEESNRPVICENS